jgi:hypothetical protein
VAAYKGHSMKYNYLTFNFTITEAFGHFYLQAMLTLDLFIYLLLIMGVFQQGYLAILRADVGCSSRSMAKNF